MSGVKCPEQFIAGYWHESVEFFRLNIQITCDLYSASRRCDAGKHFSPFNMFYSCGVFNAAGTLGHVCVHFKPSPVYKGNGTTPFARITMTTLCPAAPSHAALLRRNYAPNPSSISLSARD